MVYVHLDKKREIHAKRDRKKNKKNLYQGINQAYNAHIVKHTFKNNSELKHGKTFSFKPNILFRFTQNKTKNII